MKINEVLCKKEYQQMQVLCNQMLAELPNYQFTENLQDALRKHLPRVQGIIRILARVVVEDMKQSGFQKLATSLVSLDKKMAVFKQSALRFGCNVGQTTKRRRTQRTE